MHLLSDLNLHIFLSRFPQDSFKHLGKFQLYFKFFFQFWALFFFQLNIISPKCSSQRVSLPVAVTSPGKSRL